MDNTQINTVEWFFGYGGNHLGLKRVIPNMRLLAVCEREGYAAANMVAKMEKGLLDPTPIWTDAKTFPSRQFHGLVDLFVASYPCQGFSCAGKREGSRDPRFLWPWVYRFVIEARPSVVFFENVDGHVSLGFNSVLSDLETAGYAVEAGVFSASECGAGHQRKRLFILGYDSKFRRGEGRPQRPGWFGQSALVQSSDVADASGVREREQNNAERAESREDARQDASGRGDELGDAISTRLERRPCEPGNNGEEQPPVERTSLFWPDAPARPGAAQHAWEPPRVIKTVGGLGGGANGRAANVDRLRLLGNGVYPACAAKAFLVLAKKL